MAYLDLRQKLGKLKDKLSSVNDLYQSTQQADSYILEGLVQEGSSVSKTEVKDQLNVLMAHQKQLQSIRSKLEEPLSIKQEEFTQEKTANFEVQVDIQPEHSCLSSFWDNLDVSSHERQIHAIVNDKL